MESWKLKLYTDLLKAFQLSTNKSKSECNIEVSKLWKQLKSEKCFPENAREKIKQFNSQRTKNKNSLLTFLTRIPRPKQEAVSEEDAVQIVNVVPNPPTTPIIQSSVAGSTDVGETLDAGQLAPVTSQTVKSFDTPAQDLIKKQINVLKMTTEALTMKSQANLASQADILELRKHQKDLKKLEQTLKIKVGAQKRQQQKRKHDRKIIMTDEDVARKLKRRKKEGRPRLEEDQPDLLKAIVDIATYGGAAHERRRSEMIRSVKTLDELTEALKPDYKISRSGVYLRLLPARCNSTEGQRHITTVPVRLIRASNDGHKHHSDTMFCKASINYLEEIASIIGPKNVLFISQDDKARVPLGKTAANKQTPLLMHMDYKVTLPDHDWVVAEKHKLIPSVYGLMNIKPGMVANPKAVTYSGPTFIAIRSGKHSSSTAYSHAKDFETLTNLPDFTEHTRTTDNKIKPVVIIIADGGPDENPRYEKVVMCAISHFVKHDLDAIFIATNAPGRSAFNRVERRMAPLSRELSGLILPHDSFGRHLDNQGRTVDVELEKQNFEKAGIMLAEVWSELVIDGFPTLASYVQPNESETENFETRSAEWRWNHVRESHYFLQIVKCQDRTCCSAPRSSYFNILDRFIPAPVCVDEDTLAATENADGKNNFTPLMLRLRLNDSRFKLNNGEIPFDLCCPSVQELIVSRTCNTCGAYFASIKNLKLHQPVCRRRNNNPTLDSERPTSTVLNSRRNNRPVRLAAVRQRERMIIWTSRLNDQHCDWVDEDETVGTEVIVPNSNLNENESSRLPVIDLDTLLRPTWEATDEN